MDVLSATPQEEMKAIIKARNLEAYLKGIFGSPIKKEEHTRHIVIENGYNPKTVVSIGDGLSEYEAVRAAGYDCITRVPEGEHNRFQGLPGVRAIVHDLSNIEVYP